MDRAEATYILCSTLLSYLPSPRQPSDTLTESPGLSAGAYTLCATCDGRGRVLREKACRACPQRVGISPPPHGHHGCEDCPSCHGSGWRRRERGDVAYDAYVGERVGTEERSAPPEKLWQREKQTARQLRQTERLLESWERPEAIEEGWVLAKERMRATGSYAELERELRWLAEHFPGRMSELWQNVIVQAYGDPPDWHGIESASIRGTVQLLAARMPNEIKIPPWFMPDEIAAARKESLWRGRTSRHEEARSQRDALILAQRHEGWKISRIAQYHNLRELRVKQIIYRASQMHAATGMAS